MKKVRYVLNTLFLGIILLAFNVSAIGAGSITINAPDGAAQWEKGTTRIISWTKLGFTDNVDIELWQGGAQLPGPNGTIIANTTGLTYAYDVPAGLADGTYQIRIFAWGQTPSWSVFAISADFQIVTTALPFLTLISPNGGEVWQRGTTQSITWDDNLSSNVKIDLCDATGTYISTIDSWATGLSVNWNIPALLAVGDYKIKVSNLNNLSLFDLGTSTIHISANTDGTVTGVTPSGGTFTRGTAMPIHWVKTFSENVNIYLCNGVTNAIVSLIGNNAYGQSTTWAIPANFLPLGSYKITATGGGLTESVTVTAPIVTDSWQRGTTHAIAWTKNFVDRVDLELWATLGGDHKVSTLRTYAYGTACNWYVPTSTAAGQYKIKVIKTNDASVYGFSAAFTITSVPGGAAETVTVTSPAGGENWLRGTLHTLSWTKNFGDRIDLELWSTLGGDHKVTLLRSYVYGTACNWFIPANTDAGQYKIKVIKMGDPTVYSLSAAFNIILSTGGTCSLTYPDAAGIIIHRGSTTTITWTKTFPENVRVELWKGGAFNTLIKTSQYGLSCEWYASSMLEAGSDYKIKIMSGLDNSILDQSANNFTIAIYKFGAFPNPANNTLSLSFDDSSTGTYDMVLYNRFGDQVVTKSANMDEGYEHSISTADLPSGIYYLVVTSGDTKITRSIIVQH